MASAACAADRAAGEAARKPAAGPSQASRAAGRVPDAGRYVQPHRGRMEPGDALAGGRSAAATPIESGASQEHPPFLPRRRGRSRVT